MNDHPSDFVNQTVKNLFPSPLVICELSQDVIVKINPQIRTLVHEKALTEKSTAVSNVGGWQSDTHLADWGGPPVQTIITALRQLLKKITMNLEGDDFKRQDIDWKINGWANLNRKGHSNKTHYHPGAYWSAVYYVDAPSIEEAGSGGEIEFFDPRGPLPIMYCPLLYMGIQGYVTAGKSELHIPKEGQCIIFPSWLAHGVRLYSGDKDRISLAFNFSI